MRNIWTTLAAGVIGGAVASFVMERYQAAAGPAFGQKQEGDSATTKAADKAVGIVGAGPIPEKRKPAAGEVVHYATGLLTGLAYAVAVDRRPRVALGFGTAFGVLTMLVFDDAAVPAAGLGPTPANTSAATYAYGLTSHLVFGAVLEGTRRSVVALLD